MSERVLHYALSISNWRAHEFSVSLTIPAHKNNILSLSLPSWIPGSYMVRDFAKSVVSIKAKSETTNTDIPIVKLDKQTWQIATNGKACVIDYVVYANDLSIRSAFINDEYAFINGTSAFLCVKGYEDVCCHLDISLPQNDPHTANWQAHTSMPRREGDVSSAAWVYYTNNYAELIDHPLYIGIADHHSFSVKGVSFTVLFSGRNNIDCQRIAADLAPICEHHLTLFGEPQPIDSYLFMTLLADNGFGGLEHKYSTALLYPRYELPMLGDPCNRSDGYITFLSLCSHEFFHTWHVKRIKPDVMVTPDLSAETYTEQLWIYEGFTSFYDDVTLARTGIIEPQKYLDIVAHNISRLLQNAGRFKQSPAESSFDAWTKFYKQDASATNNIVSYYTKGGIIAFGLDLLLRNQSENRASLDKLMKLLWEQFGRDESGTHNDVIQSLCQSAFNIDIKPFIDAVVYGVEDVDLASCVESIGLSYNIRPRTSSEDKGGLTTLPALKHQLGATLKPAPLGLCVTQVFEGLAAMQAGILLNDVIIALNGHVVTQAKLQRILDNARDAVEVALVRDGRLLNVSLPVLPARNEMAFFEIKNKALFNFWLGIDN